jgi:hypothetical protein
MGPGAVLDAVVKRKIPNPHRESNPRTPIVQPHCIMRSFIICTIHVARVGKNEKCVQDFWSENLKGRNYSEDSTDGKIILE